MGYLLKHKDIDVALLFINEDGNIIKVNEVFRPEHLPLSCVSEDGKINNKRLTQWWDERGIPSSRENFRYVMAEIGVTGKNKLLLEGNGLSLTDHYWVSGEKENKKWKDVNFYENEFDKSIGGLFFNRKNQDKKYNRNTPDISSDGNLRKRLDIDKDGNRVLIKAGKSPYMQEPVNEVIAALICNRLGITHVSYTLDWENNEPVCKCPNMTDTNIEFIEAIRIYYTREPSYFENNKYKHYTDCARRLGLKNITEALEQMILLDYLILNHDRHFKNFGILRDSQTLNFICAAPIFDSGSSLYHEDGAAAITLPERPKMRTECFDTLENQLDLIKDWSWFDAQKLDGIPAECKELLLSVPTVERERAERISNMLEMRVRGVVCHLP
ncbi:MAG: HipA domain-containing protein [Treponema sp.]|nr:HipA domain-containing protein [Treponema sp.]